MRFLNSGLISSLVLGAFIGLSPLYGCSKSEEPAEEHNTAKLMRRASKKKKQPKVKRSVARKMADRKNNKCEALCVDKLYDCNLACKHYKKGSSDHGECTDYCNRSELHCRKWCNR